MMSRFHNLLVDLPRYLGGHMLLFTTSLALGLSLSLPLGIFVSRKPKLSEFALGVASILQTIPSLALLALMVPILGGRIGFWPAFFTLTVYSILPILANTIIGIRGVDPALLETADALGMSSRQRLWKVELPLAAPVIVGGVRTAAVLVIATATLATPVGQQTLGNYIFQGLNIRDTQMIVFGCVIASALAVVFDQLLRTLQVASRQKNVALLCTGIAGILVLVTCGLFQPVLQGLLPRPVIVGSADYSEQHILGDVIAGVLVQSSLRVDQRKNMPQIVGLDAVCSGAVDCYVDYTGMIWTTKMKRAPTDRQTTLKGVTKWLKTKHGVECLGPLGFENAYCLAIRKETAVEHNILTLDDLAHHASSMSIGDDTQFFHLDEWRRVRTAYGLSFREQRSMSPERMYDALQNKEVDVISGYTTDGRIAAYDLVVLSDPREAFPPYDAVLLLSKKASKDQRIRDALLPLVGAIDGVTMMAANERVDVEHWPVSDAARELINALNTGKSSSP